MERNCVVCFSGGKASALVAVEAVRRYGKKNVILLNHDISSKVEDHDIKRFKQEVADYLDLPITYANINDYENKTPISVCLDKGAFQIEAGQALCTYYLKTEPFYKWLKQNAPLARDGMNHDISILYGFDKSESVRIQRRTGALAAKGYYTDYPLAFWDRTIHDMSDVGINPPSTYKIRKHANCMGCLKAGKQSWFLCYCLRKDIFYEAVAAEKSLGYSILKNVYLEELVPKFEDMLASNICPNDKENSASFWKRVNHAIPGQSSLLPCDCSF